jgi:hypothetical protein
MDAEERGLLCESSLSSLLWCLHWLPWPQRLLWRQRCNHRARSVTPLAKGDRRWRRGPSRKCQNDAAILSLWPRGPNALTHHMPHLGLALLGNPAGEHVMHEKYAYMAAPKPPRCVRCAAPMQLLRRTSRFGGLPDLYSFYCRVCDEWHVEEGETADPSPHHRASLMACPSPADRDQIIMSKP